MEDHNLFDSGFAEKEEKEILSANIIIGLVADYWF